MARIRSTARAMVSFWVTARAMASARTIVRVIKLCNLTVMMI